MVMMAMVTMMVIRGIRRYRGPGKKRQTKHCEHQIPKLHGSSPLVRCQHPFQTTIDC